MNNEVSTRTFPIQPSRKTIAWAWGFLIFVVVLELSLVVNVGKNKDALFALIPSGLLVTGIMAAITFSLHFKKVRFEISPQGLRIRGDMWGRSLSWSELDVANARVVQFATEPELKPYLRTCGTALPGYGAGWFRLRNKAKALVFMTDEKEAVYIPTRKDFSVLLSSENNPALLQAIQQCGKV